MVVSIGIKLSKMSPELSSGIFGHVRISVRLDFNISSDSYGAYPNNLKKVFLLLSISGLRRTRASVRLPTNIASSAILWTYSYASAEACATVAHKHMQK